ncbi:MAG: glycosyltransferase family 39 protein [Acidimicrobiaceae bacterium]|nr:glycosyltransferase family 39 protein [Acidimicrobiaceae bacterium]
MRVRAWAADHLWPWLTVWTVVGFGIRLATVCGRPHPLLWANDQYYYYWGARNLLHGLGFINAFNYNLHHQVVQSAAFAPGFELSLTVPMLFGLTSYFAIRVWCAVIGAAAVFALGYAGREIAGRRVGLVAAFLLAVYPNAWISNEMTAAETLDPLLIAIVLLLAYRFWKQPSVRRIIWLGVALGAAMLARSELALLVLFILVPLALLARPLLMKRRVAMAGIGVLASAVVVAPWVGYNMSRFEKPTFISTELGITLATADCNTTFYGQFEGYWSFGCAARAPNISGDESVASADYEHDVLTYLKHHENRLIPVSLAKVGRTFGLYRPVQQIDLDSRIQKRPLHWAFVGLYTYYALAAASLLGTVLLKRRKIPVFPLWAVGVSVFLAVVITFGTTRYRAPFEACLVVLAAVALVRVWDRLLPTRRRQAARSSRLNSESVATPVLSAS